MSFLAYTLAAVQALCQVVIMVAGGHLLARKGFLSKGNQKVLSNINIYLFTPCLLFTKMAQVLSLEKFLEFWPIPVIYFAFLLCSWTVAQLGGRLLRFTPSQIKFCTAAIIFSNSNNLPIALMQSLAFSKAGEILMRDGDVNQEEIEARSISYILFFAIFGNILRWSYGYSLISAEKKSPDEQDATPEQTLPVASSGLTATPASSQDTLTIFVEEKNKNTTDVETGSLNTACLDEDNFANDSSRKGIYRRFVSNGKHLLSRYQEKIPAPLKKVTKGFFDFMTAPLWTVVIALIVGLTPPLKDFFFNKSSFVYGSFTKALDELGAASIPLILVGLGAQMTGLSLKSQGGNAALLRFVIVTRQFLMPLFVFPLMLLFVRVVHTPLASDPAFVVTMIVLGCAPTAINLVQICMAEQQFEEEMSKILFWSYCVFGVPIMVAVVMMSLWMVSILQL
ncbi:uncharacterized protein VTP21DRAFT_1775 [Calcarisporiella thermophila]|uniref:uncharacterized protein n=1 Tax=Calcarisporiella thermophila TaxID=911321 RepID=UPI0037448ABE